MEKNIQNYNFIKEKFEECLKSINFFFENIDCGDSDLNYVVSFDAPEPFKFIDTMQCVMFADIGGSNITLLSINIYSIDFEKDITPFYKLVNDVNAIIAHGKFSVRKDIHQIIYSASIDCGENFQDLTAKKIKLLADDYVRNLVPLFIAIQENNDKANMEKK